MKTENNILIAFILNLFFSAFEFMGGILTGSVAIISDAVHDIGDATSIGISYFFERKSKKQPDAKYTYGYGRYSVISGGVSALLLLFGSVWGIYNSIVRIIKPVPINHNGMIILAVAGVLVNTTGAFFTRHGDSVNQKSVNLHMLEDVLGWLIVLVGAVIIKFTDFVLIDPILSFVVSVFIITNALKNINQTACILLDKAPENINIEEIIKHIKTVTAVKNIHHIHIWSMDGINNYATMHIVTNADSYKIKKKVRKILSEYNICHATIESEKEYEECHEKLCRIDYNKKACHHHHH